MSVARRVRSADVEAVNSEAREAVRAVYRTARATASDPHAKFNAALETYCKVYPDISRPMARRAVALIIAPSGNRQEWSRR